jgi:hypothetical protein
MKSKLEQYFDNIKQRYMNGETAKEICKDYNVYPGSIIHLLRTHNIPLRPSGQRKGNLSWNKGKILSQQEKADVSRELFKTGDVFELQEQTIRTHAKRILINEQGNCCSICKITIWNDKPVPLVCDHIDGNPMNNNFNNFRIICCNCDAQLPTYKSKNRGRGRQYDRERYHITK